VQRAEVTLEMLGSLDAALLAECGNQPQGGCFIVSRSGGAQLLQPDIVRIGARTK
jgi:hypothetical protein